VTRDSLAAVFAAALAIGSALGRTPPAAAQGDFIPDASDPRTAAEARRWLDGALGDIESGRKVIVPTPQGPLPYLIVDRAALADARELAPAGAGAGADAASWAAAVLRQQDALRSRLERSRAGVAARAGAGPGGGGPGAGGPGAGGPGAGGPGAGGPGGAAPRLLGVVRGTPDDPVPAPARPAERPRAADGADPTATAPLPARAGEAAPAEATADPRPGDLELEPLPSGPASTSAPPELAPATPAAAPAGAYGGGGARVRRSVGGGLWIVIGLAALASVLGAGLLAARRRPGPGPAAPAAAPSPPIELLLDVAGPAGERSRRFTTVPISIGRDPASDLVLEDPRVSRHHARIVVHGRELWIEDLGSAAGLEVDGRAVERAPLARGTVVRLGDSRLAVR
jgi:hypothetical protein